MDRPNEKGRRKQAWAGTQTGGTNTKKLLHLMGTRSTDSNAPNQDMHVEHLLVHPVCAGWLLSQPIPHKASHKLLKAAPCFSSPQRPSPPFPLPLTP